MQNNIVTHEGSLLIGGVGGLGRSLIVSNPFLNFLSIVMGPYCGPSLSRICGKNFWASFLRRGMVATADTIWLLCPIGKAPRGRGEFGGTLGRNGVSGLGGSFGVSITGVWLLEEVPAVPPSVGASNDDRLLPRSTISEFNSSLLPLDELTRESEWAAAKIFRSIRTCGMQLTFSRYLASRLSATSWVVRFGIIPITNIVVPVKISREWKTVCWTRMNVFCWDQILCWNLIANQIHCHRRWSFRWAVADGSHKSWVLNFLKNNLFIQIIKFDIH